MGEGLFATRNIIYMVVEEMGTGSEKRVVVTSPRENH
jgi:hypothetical protein